MYIYVIIIDDFVALSKTVIVLYFSRLSHIILYLCSVNLYHGSRIRFV